MLVLTRRLGEAIVLDSHIVVRVIGIDHGKVRLGIAAPVEILVDRDEVHQRRQLTAEPKEACR